jgi:hypothetical protein
MACQCLLVRGELGYPNRLRPAVHFRDQIYRKIATNQIPEIKILSHIIC